MIHHLGGQEGDLAPNAFIGHGWRGADFSPSRRGGAGWVERPRRTRESFRLGSRISSNHRPVGGVGQDRWESIGCRRCRPGTVFPKDPSNPLMPEVPFRIMYLRIERRPILGQRNGVMVDG